jgi:hypothetical protein
MSIRPLASLLATALLVGQAASATALTVLTTGKHAVFTAKKARVQVGRDPRLSPLADPQCGGVETRIQIAAYPQATNRLEAQEEVVLPCANWKRAGKGYLYRDDTGAAGGVIKVLYSTKRLQVQFKGDQYVPIAGPVGYAELWFTVDTTRFLARFHNFTKNTATTLATLKASRLAGEGEAAFWEVLLGDDKSDANQLRALDLLGRATAKTRKDGRSPFLCGMMHLYRYGLFVDGAGEPTEASRVEIDAAVDAFDVALPRVWKAEAGTGDSRVPGFVAAATFAQGYAHGHEARMNEGLALLQEAIDVNPSFNTFDLIPVLQALPASDPRWQQAYDDVITYLEDPDTFSCVGTQPESCGNRGLALHNVGGSLLLFGDVYAKAARPESLERATFWYGLAQAIGSLESPWAFQSIADERVADVANRIARYQDDDPANDDPIIGIQEENCATCHNR